MRNFDDLENTAFEHNDSCLLIDDACENGSTEQFRAYVKQIFTCTVQGMITEDILEEQGIDFDEDLMDWIGNIDVSIPDMLRLRSKAGMILKRFRKIWDMQRRNLR